MPGGPHDHPDQAPHRVPPALADPPSYGPALPAPLRQRRPALGGLHPDPHSAGQEQTFAPLLNSQAPVALEQLYPFLWAVLYASLVFPLVNGALAWAASQALQQRPVQILAAYRAAWPCWGRLLAVYWGYGAVLMVVGLVLTLLARWYKPTLWHRTPGA